jgi:hypothetical protein
MVRFVNLLQHLCVAFANNVLAVLAFEHLLTDLHLLFQPLIVLKDWRLAVQFDCKFPFFFLSTVEVDRRLLLENGINFV